MDDPFVQDDSLDKTTLTVAIDGYLAAQGDSEDRRLQQKNDIISAVSDRVVAMTRRMMRHESTVRRWDQTEDVAQIVLVKLWKALDEIEVRDSRSLMALTARHIRWLLIDQARKHRGPMSMGGNHATVFRDDDGDASPIDAIQSESSTDDGLHEIVDTLPDDLREVIDLVYYHGMTHVEAAAALSVTKKTIGRRLRRAQLELKRRLGEAGSPDEAGSPVQAGSPDEADRPDGDADRLDANSDQAPVRSPEVLPGDDH